LPDIKPKIFGSDVPSAESAAIRAIATRAAMKAYSIAVATASSAKTALKIANMTISETGTTPRLEPPPPLDE